VFTYTLIAHPTPRKRPEIPTIRHQYKP